MIGQLLECLLRPCTATVLQPVWPKGLSAWRFELKYIPLGPLPGTLVKGASDDRCRVPARSSGRRSPREIRLAPQPSHRDPHPEVEPDRSLRSALHTLSGGLPGGVKVRTYCFYQSVIARAIENRRPHMQGCSVALKAIAEALAGFGPQAVVCSHPGSEYLSGGRGFGWSCWQTQPRAETTAAAGTTGGSSTQA